MALGNLVVRVGLDAAEFFTGLTRAEGAAKKFSKDVDGISKSQQNALTSANVLGRGLGLVFGAAATAAGVAVVAIDQLIKSVAKFKDLEERTGASGEGFAGLAVAAAVGGAAMEDIASISVKLTKNLDNVKGSAKSTAAGLAALKIPVKEFLALDPVARYERLAKALDKFADGPGKTAALEAIARGASTLLPFLKELNAQGGRQVVITQAQIDLADKYADMQTRLGAQIKQQLQKAALEAAPAMLALIQVVQDFVTGLTSAANASTALGVNAGIRTFAEDAGRALASIATIAQSIAGIFNIVRDTITSAGKAAVEVANINLAKLGTIGDSLRRIDALVGDSQRRTISTIKDQVTPSQRFEKKLIENRFDVLIEEQEQALRFGKAAAKKPDVAKIADFTTNRASRTAKDDPTNRILDGQIKALEASIARERDILSARQNFLRDNFSDGFISVANYYAQVQQVRDEALRNTIVAYDKEIAAIKDVQAKRKKETEVQGDQNKIDDIREKQANLLRDAQTQEESLSRERTRATEQYGIQLSELNAKMLELSGNTAEAAKIRFNTANLGFNRLLSASGNTQGLAQQAALEKQVFVQGKLNDKSREFQNILDGVGIEQERLNIQLQTGAIGEIAGLVKRSELNKSRIGELQKIHAEYVKIATASENPADLIKAKQLLLVIERLSAETELLAQKFNGVFADSFTNAFGEFISSTKRAKDAAKDFAKSVTQQINQIASRNIADALFGKGGPASGIGGFFADLFGGGGKAATKGADPAAQAATALAASTTTSAASITALGTATSATVLAFPTLDTGLGSLALAAETAATALLSIGKDAGSFTDLLSAPKAATPALSDADAASLLGLSTAAKSTTTALGGVTSASTAMDVALTPLMAGFANLNTSAGSVAGTLLSTGKNAGLFSDFLGKAANAPEFSVDTSALLGLNTAAASTTSALATVASASAATKSAMAPLTAGFAGLNTSAQSVASALRTTGKDVLSDLSNAIVVDTSAFDKSLLGLNTAAASTTSALAAVASSSAATDLAMTPLMAGFAGLSTSADTVANVLLATGKDAGLFSDFLSKAASSPGIVVDTSQLLGLNAAATGTTSALASVANASAATESAMTPLRAGFVNLSTSAETFAASLLATGKDAFTDFSKVTAPTALSGADVSSLLGLSTAAKSTTTALAAVSSASTAADIALTPLTAGFSNLSTSADVMASAFRLTGKDLVADLSNAIVIDPAAFDKSLVGINSAAASTSSALASVASASSATNLAMTPLQTGFSTLSTSATDFASSLVASSKDALASLTNVPVPSIVTPDAGLLAFDAALTTSTTVLSTNFAAIELAMTPFGASLISLTAAAQTAAAALLTVASSKGAGAMGDLFSEFAGSALGGMAQGGGFAMGGNPPVGKASWVGERGMPELFIPKVAGTIVPNDRLTGGGPVTSNVFHINVLPGATRQSADQAAVAVGREVARATARKA